MAQAVALCCERHVTVSASVAKCQMQLVLSGFHTFVGKNTCHTCDSTPSTHALSRSSPCEKKQATLNHAEYAVCRGLTKSRFEAMLPRIWVGGLKFEVAKGDLNRVVQPGCGRPVSVRIHRQCSFKEGGNSFAFVTVRADDEARSLIRALDGLRDQSVTYAGLAAQLAVPRIKELYPPAEASEQPAQASQEPAQASKEPAQAEEPAQPKRQLRPKSQLRPKASQEPEPAAQISSEPAQDPDEVEALGAAAETSESEANEDEPTGTSPTSSASHAEITEVTNEPLPREQPILVTRFR